MKKYFISTGEENKMFTLRVECRMYSHYSRGMIDSNEFLTNLSTNWKDAVTKAKKFIADNGVLLNEDEPFILEDITRGISNNIKKWSAPIRRWFTPQITFESTFVGEVGEQIKVNLKLVNSFGFDTQFGFCVIKKFEDANNNIFTTTSTKQFISDLEIGDNISMVVKVKQHKYFRGGEQTVFNYPKLITN